MSLGPSGLSVESVFPAATRPIPCYCLPPVEVTGLSEHATHSDGRTADRDENDGIESIETYETDEGVVFYDAENPLAWLEAGETFSLREHA